MKECFLIETVTFQGEYREADVKCLGITPDKDTALNFIKEYAIKHNIGDPEPKRDDYYKQETWTTGDLYGTRAKATKLPVLDMSQL
jgi:hypothetical protein